MKNPALYLVILASFLFSRCSDDTDDPITPITGSNIVTITNDITVTTVWDSDSIYVISDPDFWVEATLTIRPGTIVKFSSGGKYMSIGSYGTVIAEGTALKPIIFTSIKDDSRGGDTNKDGSLLCLYQVIGGEFLANQIQIFLNIANSIMVVEALIYQRSKSSQIIAKYQIVLLLLIRGAK